MPTRVQRKRTKGWRMPENTLYAGRGTKWGNPWKVGETRYGKPITQELACDYYREHIGHPNSALQFVYEDIKQLRGKNLACWCRLDQPCHVDVLLEYANS